MSITYLLQGVFIGIVFGVPLGVVGLLSIQRMISYNKIAGIITGIASSIVDVIYASIGIMGLSFITDFIVKYEKVISIVGAIIIAILGIGTFLKKSISNNINDDKSQYLSMFVSSFLVAITNPTTILSFLFVFAVFGIGKDLNIINGLLLVSGIFIGTCCWWIILSFFIKLFKNKINDKIYKKLNNIFGAMLITLSVVILLKNVI